MSKISIVFLTYDNIEDLKRSYQSVKEVSKLIGEVIVIDSSHDQAIANFVRTEVNQKFKYKWEKPEGIYHAMNSALFIADSDNFLWFLNPGDTLIDAKPLHNLIIEMKAQKSVWGYAQAKKIIQGHVELYPSQDISMTAENVASGRLSISHQAMLVKSEVLRKMGGFDERYRIAADLKLQIGLMANFTPTFIPELFVLIDPSGISHKFIFQTFMETLKVRYSTRAVPKYKVVLLAFRYVVMKVYFRLKFFFESI